MEDVEQILSQIAAACWQCDEIQSSDEEDGEDDEDEDELNSSDLLDQDSDLEQEIDMTSELVETMHDNTSNSPSNMNEEGNDELTSAALDSCQHTSNSTSPLLFILFFMNLIFRHMFRQRRTSA